MGAGGRLAALEILKDTPRAPRPAPRVKHTAPK